MALSAKRPSKAQEVKEQIMQEVTGQKPVKKKNLNLLIPADIHKQIKMKAVEEGRSVTAITLELWQEFMKK